MLDLESDWAGDDGGEALGESDGSQGAQGAGATSGRQAAVGSGDGGSPAELGGVEPGELLVFRPRRPPPSQVRPGQLFRGIFSVCMQAALFTVRSWGLQAQGRGA